MNLKQAHATGETTMKLFTKISECAIAMREFVAPTYHPERHYMRGPGPACARRDHHQPRQIAFH